MSNIFGDGSYLDLNGTKQMTGNIDAGSNLITNLQDPSNTSDGATKNYVDSHSNLKFKRITQLAGPYTLSSTATTFSFGFTDGLTVGNPHIIELIFEVSVVSNANTAFQISYGGTTSSTTTPDSNAKRLYQQFAITGYQISTVTDKIYISSAGATTWDVPVRADALPTSNAIDIMKITAILYEITS